MTVKSGSVSLRSRKRYICRWVGETEAAYLPSLSCTDSALLSCRADRRASLRVSRTRRHFQEARRQEGRDCLVWRDIANARMEIAGSAIFRRAGDYARADNEDAKRWMRQRVVENISSIASSSHFQPVNWLPRVLNVSLQRVAFQKLKFPKIRSLKSPLYRK